MLNLLKMQRTIIEAAFQKTDLAASVDEDDCRTAGAVTRRLDESGGEEPLPLTAHTGFRELLVRSEGAVSEEFEKVVGGQSILGQQRRQLPLCTSDLWPGCVEQVIAQAVKSRL